MQIDIGIYRSRNNRWIRGVCGGIAESLGIAAIWVRLAFLVASVVVPGVSLITMIVLYVVLGILLPEKNVL
jgi:phage shock protein PspC (stress-responsive transcriptional regulator)